MEFVLKKRGDPHNTVCFYITCSCNAFYSVIERGLSLFYNY